MPEKILCPTCDAPLEPYIERTTVYRTVETCACGLSGRSAWQQGGATPILRVGPAASDAPLSCAWHTGVAPAPQNEVLTCQVCGAYLTCVYCRTCNQLYPDHHYEPVCEQVQPPARHCDLETDPVCQGCWDEIKEDLIRDKHEDEQPDPAAA